MFFFLSELDVKRTTKTKDKAPKKPAPPRPPPPPTANVYRPVISEAKESDFMANLLSDFANDIKPTPRPPPKSPSRKRKPVSPEGRGSVDVFGNERAGSVSHGSSRSTDKKPRVALKAEEDVVMEDPEFGMQFMGSPEWGSDDEDPDQTIKPDEDDDEEDDIQVKPKRADHQAVSSSTSASSFSVGSASTTTTVRKVVNATSVAVKTPNILRPLPNKEEEGDEPSMPDWLALSESLTTAIPPSSDQTIPSSPPVQTLPPNYARTKQPVQKGAPIQTTVDALEPDGRSLRMFWLDFHEHDVKLDGGSTKHLYLFGKVWDRKALGGKGKWVSCCLKVNGLERNLFIAPRERTFSSFFVLLLSVRISLLVSFSDAPNT